MNDTIEPSDADQSEVYDASNPKHIARKKRKDAQRQSLSDAGLRYILAHQGGRAYLNLLLERCHTYVTSFHANSSVMCRNEGERNIGLQIIADIVRVDEPKILTLMTELKEVNHD